MRGKLWFLGGLAAGFVLGARAGRERYEEIVTNARKVWEHPTVQEAAGVAQAQANRLYTEGKDKLAHTKLGEKLNSGQLSSSAGDKAYAGSTTGSSTGSSTTPPPSAY
jgi:hypothetical protein